MLAYLRRGDTFAELAAGFGVGTAWRYVTETTALLAARAPQLRPALASAKTAGHAYVVIDGTLIPIDRVAAAVVALAGQHDQPGGGQLGEGVALAQVGQHQQGPAVPG